MHRICVLNSTKSQQDAGWLAAWRVVCKALQETKGLRTGLVHKARQALCGRALGAGVRRGERRHLVEALPQRRHVVLPQLAELKP